MRFCWRQSISFSQQVKKNLPFTNMEESRASRCSSCQGKKKQRNSPPVLFTKCCHTVTLQLKSPLGNICWSMKYGSKTFKLDTVKLVSGTWVGGESKSILITQNKYRHFAEEGTEPSWCSGFSPSCSLRESACHWLLLYYHICQLRLSSGLLHIKPTLFKQLLI